MNSSASVRVHKASRPYRTGLAFWAGLLAVGGVLGLGLLVVITGGSAPVPSASPMPGSPDLRSAAASALVEPGSAVEISAVDAIGEWGTIHIERQRDRGGYRDAEVHPESFIIEFSVTYDALRTPEPPEFGASDWQLRPTSRAADGYFEATPMRFALIDGAGFRPATPLGEYPGATDILSTPPQGTIAFEVPREAANVTLELVYVPSGLEVVSAVVAREPAPPPEPVAVDRPSPPAAVGYVTIEGLPFPVLDNAAADQVFAVRDECRNNEVGYTGHFPDEWYTNTATNGVAACSWFAPDFFEVDEPGEVPDGIWIISEPVAGTVGYTSATKIFYTEDVVVDGRDARRVEFNPDPTADSSYREYQYVVPLDSGLTLVASTNTSAADDYELSKAVLDRLMAAIDIDD